MEAAEALVRIVQEFLLQTEVFCPVRAGQRLLGIVRVFGNLQLRSRYFVDFMGQFTLSQSFSQFFDHFISHFVVFASFLEAFSFLRALLFVLIQHQLIFSPAFLHSPRARVATFSDEQKDSFVLLAVFHEVGASLLVATTQ